MVSSRNTRPLDHLGKQRTWLGHRFLDEVWWSRFALPRLHAWQERDEPVRLSARRFVAWRKSSGCPCLTGYVKLMIISPCPSKTAWKVSPCPMGTAAHIAPGSTSCPASRLVPNS